MRQLKFKKFIKGTFESDQNVTNLGKKVRYYKSKACLLANNCCEKCEAMYKYGNGKYCCFDNVIRFIEYVNKYKIEIL